MKMRYLKALQSCWIIFGVLLGLAISSGSAVGQQNTGLTPIVRFDSSMKSAEVVTTFQFVVKNWIIDGGQTIKEFPEHGFLIMQLRGGELTTIIDGERQERHEDEFWTVPDGSTLGLVTDDDSAIIQTVSIYRN